MTTAQALELGYTYKEIRSLLRRGEWVRVRHGAYTSGKTWAHADERQRHLIVVRAALLALGDESVASHDSAAVAHDLPTWGLNLTVVMLTRPFERTSRREAGVEHHLAELPVEQITTVRGVRVTSAVRTALDVARKRGYEAGLVSANAAMHAGGSHAEMQAAALLMTEWPGGAASSAVVRDADGRIETPGETLTWILLQGMALDVEPQVCFREIGARVDFELKGLGVIIEFDGRVKYVTEDGQPDVQALWEEKKREDRIRDLGYEVVRVYWEELFGSRRIRTEQRIRAAIARAARSSRLAG
ncbi:MAG: type IV toxin-antitoxin system AbiEi family antitoxin domain-containing protein [Actinomycetota bacterium]|nr:type IV toxin-antitoxin system AbiEi family antitoxin domain-containing protein [Actinomycetota bacterium]